MLAALSASHWLIAATLAALAGASYWRETRKQQAAAGQAADPSGVVVAQKIYADNPLLSNGAPDVATLRRYVRILRAELAQLADPAKRTDAATDLDGVAEALAALQLQLDAEAAKAEPLTKTGAEDGPAHS